MPSSLRPLLDLADWHGVLAIVMENLKALAERAPGSSAASAADPAAWEWGRKQLRLRAGQSLALRRQAQELTGSLREAGLPVFVLKGSEFADRLYPHPALRPFTDVDLLVPHRAIPEIRQLLAASGYGTVTEPMKHPTGYGEETWQHPQRTLGLVEIHWNLVNSPRLQRAVSVTYEDLQPDPGHLPPRPSPAALLLIAAVHSVVGHGIDRLQPIGDVVQAVRGAAGGLDEAWLDQALARTGAGRALATALAFAHRIYGEAECLALGQRLGIQRRAWPGKWLLTRGAVLRAHAASDSFRRQMLRELLKRT